jgi:hypothetical protein
VTILNATARATLRAAGITPSEWARRNWSANGTWSGDVCGCPDNRCANGFHHLGADDCGCLPTLLGELLNGDRHHAFAPSLSEAWDIIAAASKLHARVALRDADGKHFDICAICCTSGPDRRRTKECEDDHQHAPWPAPRCPTAHVLSGGKPGE